MKKIAALFLTLAVFYACDAVNQLAGAYNITQCKYEYKSISGLSLAGVSLQNASSLSSLNPVAMAQLLAAFTSSSGSLPLNFTLNLDVSNPNVQAAALSGLSYILSIDGNEMTQGTLDRQISIAAGETAVLPVQLAFDLKQALSGKSIDAIKNLALNFAGIGSGSSNVTFRLKPSVNVGGYTVAAPSYIPVSFTVSGGK
jgi:LEA14-like dessication related protein